MSNKKLKNSWVNYKALFSKKELLINNYQVMQSWEDNYMKELANTASSRGGDVLELGYGLGISASYIQKNPKVKTHTIIECHPDVIGIAAERFKKKIALGKIILVNGFWEDITPKLKDSSFDGILFDTCPINKETVFFHFFPFFKEAYRLLKKDGVFSYFSDEEKEFSKEHLKKLKEAGFKKIDYKVCLINPPKDCRYWRKNSILVPVIRK